MRKSNNGSPLLFKIGCVVVICAFLAVIGFVLLQNWEANNGRFEEHAYGSSVIEHNGKKYALKKNVETFLVMGLDKFGNEAVSDSYNNDRQADFLMLFVLDNDTKQYTALHINRDTMVDVNVLGVAGNKVDTLFKQIALAHTYGNGDDVSCRNTADSVSSLLKGMKINHYVSVTMDTIPILNDLVGGVEVEILDDFSGIDSTLVKGETVRLNGEQALLYVRERQGLADSSNVTRMNRQKQYVNALYALMYERMEADEEFVVEASLKIADYIVSDRSVTQLQAISQKLHQYEFSGIQNIEGEAKQGEEFMEFYPDEKALQDMIVDLFYSSINDESGR